MDIEHWQAPSSALANRQKVSQPTALINLPEISSTTSTMHSVSLCERVMITENRVCTADSQKLFFQFLKIAGYPMFFFFVLHRIPLFQMQQSWTRQDI